MSQPVAAHENRAYVALVVEELIFESHMRRYRGDEMFRVLSAELQTLARAGADLSGYLESLVSAFVVAHPQARDSLTRPFAIHLMRSLDGEAKIDGKAEMLESIPGTR